MHRAVCQHVNRWGSHVRGKKNVARNAEGKNVYISELNNTFAFTLHFKARDLKRKRIFNF